MPEQDLSVIDAIRAHSRSVVRELGFMHATLADTDHPPSAVHALLEIQAQGSMTAVQIAGFLGLEKSSVSRMLRKLIDAGELSEAPDQTDLRVKRLKLTAKGRRTVTGIHAFGRDQVASALDRLPSARQRDVARGLSTYALALRARHSAPALATLEPISVCAGYRPGAIGRVVEMHASFYSRHCQFGQFFESKVASELAEFSARLDQACNGLWLAVQNDRIVGSVAIDGQDLPGHQAHLRWFILDQGLRGQGVGRRLLDQALNFCDEQGFKATQLWTLRGLDAARRLYESSGFELSKEYPGRQWGKKVVEQHFVRPAPGV